MAGLFCSSIYSSGVGKTRIDFAEAEPPRPLPSASRDRVSGYVVSLAENPPLAPRAASHEVGRSPGGKTGRISGASLGKLEREKEQHSYRVSGTERRLLRRNLGPDDRRRRCREKLSHKNLLVPVWCPMNAEWGDVGLGLVRCDDRKC